MKSVITVGEAKQHVDNDDTLQAKVVPTLLANYAVWPLAHALNFYYVPTEQRILYNNVVAVRSCPLVFMSQRDRCLACPLCW